MTAKYPLRPFLPADAMALRELFAQSIEELTQDDYDEDQRAAWVVEAEDAEAFAKRLAGMTTIVIQQGSDHLGFAALKDDKAIDMLFVHPHYAGEGVGTALCDALERIAQARGSDAITVDASESAVAFYEVRGYQALQRNSVPRGDVWLTNTTMRKNLKPAAPVAPPSRPQ